MDDINDDNDDMEEKLTTAKGLLLSEEYSKKIQALDVITDINIYDVVALHEINFQVLCPVFHCVLGIVRSDLPQVLNTINGEDEYILKILHRVTTGMDYVKRCLDCVSKRMMNGTDVLEVDSLFTVLPDIFKIVFRYCREIGELYSAETPQIVPIQNALNLVFQRAKDNLTVYASILENFFKFSEDSVRHLETVLDDVLEYHGYLVDLDYNTLGVAWKLFARLCKNYRFILSHFCFEKSIRILSDYALKALNSVVEEGAKEKKMNREIQINIFLLKILKQQCEFFPDNLGTDFRPLIELINNVLTVAFYHDIHLFPDNVKDKLKNEVSSIVVLIIKDLTRDGNVAADLLLNPSNHSQNILLVLAILTHLPYVDREIRQRWLTGNRKKDLVYKFFDLLDNSSPFMNGKSFLLGAQYEGKPVSIVTTYDYVLSHFQSFVAALKSDEFEIVERALFEVVMNSNPNSFWSKMLAVDCWCFIARFGSPSLCFAHMKLLISVYIQMSAKENLFLEILIGRMFTFLTEKDMRTFIEYYPVRDYLHLWSLSEKPSVEVINVCYDILKSFVRGDDAGDVISAITILSRLPPSNIEDPVYRIWRNAAEYIGDFTFAEYSDFFAALLVLTGKIINKLNRADIVLDDIMKVFGEGPITHSLWLQNSYFINCIDDRFASKLFRILEDNVEKSSNCLTRSRLAVIATTLKERKILYEERHRVEEIPSFDDYEFLTSQKGQIKLKTKKRRREEEEEEAQDQEKKMKEETQEKASAKIAEILTEAARKSESEFDKRIESLSDEEQKLFKRVISSLKNLISSL